jgi:hypothetical protein
MSKNKCPEMVVLFFELSPSGEVDLPMLLSYTRYTGPLEIVKVY